MGSEAQVRKRGAAASKLACKNEAKSIIVDEEELKIPTRGDGRKV